MSAAAILRDSAAAGVTLSLSATGTIKATGDQSAVARWLATIKENKAGIVAALAVEPIKPGKRQPDALLTGRQEAAVLAWLARIGETDQAIVAEVLTQCEQAAHTLAYYLGRAGADPQIDDDRRCCSQCLNLRGAVCVVARPGGLVSAIVGYRPASPRVLQRCAGYAPNASDTDQRAGRERWPGLIHYSKGAT